MTQAELNRAIARATGESVSEIKHLGFGLADPDVVLFDPEPAGSGRYVDWDELDADRAVLFPLPLRRRVAVN